MKIKLFMYRKERDSDPTSIHAIKNADEFGNYENALCTRFFIKNWEEDSINHLDTSKPFCQDCTEILQDDYSMDIKQLAINQKLGVK